METIIVNDNKPIMSKVVMKWGWDWNILPQMVSTRLLLGLSHWAIKVAQGSIVSFSDCNCAWWYQYMYFTAARLLQSLIISQIAPMSHYKHNEWWNVNEIGIHPVQWSPQVGFWVWVMRGTKLTCGIFSHNNCVWWHQYINITAATLLQCFMSHNRNKMIDEMWLILGVNKNFR